MVPNQIIRIKAAREPGQWRGGRSERHQEAHQGHALRIGEPFVDRPRGLCLTGMAKDRVGEDVGESAAKIKEAVDENVTELTDHARDYIRENPLSACATALAAGVALALLLKR